MDADDGFDDLDALMFRFDLEGFCVVRGALSPAEVAAANAAIDAHAGEAIERTDPALRNARAGSALAGDGARGRVDLGGMLGWEDPAHNAVFRSVLAHPKLVPILHRLVGEGYRMDHLPLVIMSDAGAEGFALHGGPLNCDGSLNPTLEYRWCGGPPPGRAHNSLLAASVQLVDHEPGDGGFVVVPGSHKLNVPVPRAMVDGAGRWRDALRQPATKAGDIVLFSEATVHGAAPWTRADKQRRIALYRFSPSTIAYGRSYSPAWPDAMLAGMTSAAQRAVLEPPYAVRLDRPCLTPTTAAAAAAAAESSGSTDEEGRGADEPPAPPPKELTEPFDVQVQSRAPAKKAFDRDVFKAQYF